MKRYILPVIFTIAVIALYHFVNINFFTVDLARRVKNALFMIRNVPTVDESVVLYNVGKLGPEELAQKIDSLLTAEPKKIGVNVCHWLRVPLAPLIQRYKSDSRVVFTSCSDSSPNEHSAIIDDENTVTHFKTDKPDYFELTLTGFTGRGNSTERINYGPRRDYPVHKGELTDSYFWYDPDHLKGKIILIGYMGDYITEEMMYFQRCRITPLNPDYGYSNITPDMYDIEISANILRTIHDNDFINEINPFVRILIILAFSLVNVVALTFIRTRWTAVNLLIAVVFFILLNGLGPMLMVLLFDKGYFLEMDELFLVLVITTVFTVFMNTSQKKAKASVVDIPSNNE